MKMMVCPILDKCEFRKSLKSPLAHCFAHEKQINCTSPCRDRNGIIIESNGCIPYDLKHIMKEVLKKDNEGKLAK